METSGVSKSSSSNERIPRRGRAHWPAGAREVALMLALTALAGGAPRLFAQEPGAAPQEQTLHVLLGKSVVINLESRLQRVLISNPAVIDAVTTSPRQIVVNAKAVGETSLILWDEATHMRMLDVIVDLDVIPLRDSLQLAYPSLPIQVQAEEGRVIVSGTVPSQQVVDDVVKMAGVFSKEVVNSMTVDPPHEKQILLKVRFAEVDRTKLDQFGVNIVSTGAFNTPGVISTQQFGAVSGAQGTGGGTTVTGTTNIGGKTTTSTFSFSDILNIFLFRPDLNLATTIKLLQQRNVLQILAEPNLMALNGKQASFLAGGEFPFPVVQGGTNFTAVTIQFRPFGVRLGFTGYIVGDNVVRLQVSPEVSTLDFTNALTISGFLVPAVSTRRAETEIELKSGQSFGIAGLMDHRTQLQMSKIPGIGDLPVIGQLFRSRNVNLSRTELVVLVTPEIVDPVNAAVAPVREPKMPIPELNVPKFDRGVPGGNGTGATPKPNNP